MINNLDHESIKIPATKEGFGKTEKKDEICITVFCYENNLFYPLRISDEKFENCMDLSMITDENKSYCVYIENFNRFMCNEIKNNNKNTFASIAWKCFSSESVFMEHKETCLNINRIQTAKLRSGSIKFKNRFKQLAVSFKIYTDFESVLKGFRGSYRKNNTSYT